MIGVRRSSKRKPSGRFQGSRLCGCFRSFPHQRAWKERSINIDFDLRLCFFSSTARTREIAVQETPRKRLSMAVTRPTKPTSDKNTHKLALRGSSKLISEFFEFSIHTILFQRAVYPAEDFTAVKKYGLNMLVSADDQVKAYIKKIMGQLKLWMVGGKISKLVVVISSKDDGEIRERWEFGVEILGGKDSKEKQRKITRSGDENDSPVQPEPESEKTEEEIQAEISAIFRQITASVTFLPVLDSNCTFNVLVYADSDSDVPIEWGDSDAKEVIGGEKVQLRSFSTTSHRVDTVVSYRLID